MISLQSPVPLCPARTVFPENVLNLALATMVCALAGAVAATPAVAQTLTPDGSANARIHLGGVALDPKLNVRNIGVDSNVFNDGTNQTHDLTLSIGPALDSWVRAGRLAMTGASTLDWNYFHKSASQRSFDVGQAGRADLDVGVVTPHAEGAVEHTRQRLNVELDARVERRTTRTAAGIRVRLGARTTLDLTQDRRRIEFDDMRFQDVNLNDALSRRERNTAATFRHVLTPLTTLVLAGGARQDRFLRSSGRDANTSVLTGGLEFKPLALVSGRASVGFRSFSPIATTILPDYRGVVANVDLSAVMHDLTRWTLGVVRDVDYSYEAAEGYFVSTGLTASVTQALGSGWDVVARGSTTALAYRDFAMDTPTSGTTRRDRVNVAGLGVGRRLGSSVRIGLDAIRAIRRSTTNGRGYDSVRVGGSVTYGF
jgi:hypothetical protein